MKTNLTHVEHKNIIPLQMKPDERDYKFYNNLGNISFLVSLPDQIITIEIIVLETETA